MCHNLNKHIDKNLITITFYDYKNTVVFIGQSDQLDQQPMVKKIDQLSRFQTENDQKPRRNENTVIVVLYTEFWSISTINDETQKIHRTGLGCQKQSVNARICIKRNRRKKRVK